VEVTHSREITSHVKYVNAIMFAKISGGAIARLTVPGCGTAELDYNSPHMEIYFDEHKSNYTFIRFTQKCFLDPTKRIYSQVKSF